MLIVGATSAIAAEVARLYAGRGASLVLTGRNPAVVWWLPTPTYNGSQSLTSLLPAGVWPLLAGLAALTIVVLALGATFA